jgi:murein DD-endopeptidase MepM/ murein hydrolase activator NlpD
MGLKVKKRKRALDKPRFNWYCSGAIFYVKGVRNLLKNKRLSPMVVIIACVLVFLPMLVTLVIRMESEPPSVKFELSSMFIGMDKDLEITLEDQKSGLKRFWVAILQDGKETTLLEKHFPASGILHKGSVISESIHIKIEPQNIGLKDGNAMLRMMAVDYSWRSWGKGNRAYSEKEIVIDTEAPIVRALTRSHNISPGGSNAVAYALSEPCDISGVQVADRFYPGYPDSEGKADTRIAFFALNDQQHSGTEIVLLAKDRAGNQTKTGFPHYIKTKKFKKDTIRISDKFILGKLPEFKKALAGHNLESPLDKFLFINRKMRAQNRAVLKQLMQQSDPTKYWNGTFLRLPKSATRSGFGDRRTYRYSGKTIDKQTHLGIDLASIAMSPIPAANSGKVIYVETLGIYGRIVVIDHGFGLFSMYAHLSGFNVHIGQMVKKGEIIGNTGKSGLAGGDHLHYSILISGTFVDPLEWWDASWIHNNITNKVERFGEGE